MAGGCAEDCLRVAAPWSLRSYLLAMRLLGDEDVRRLRPDEAVRAMREALRSHAEGTYLSPPRLSMTLGESRVLFGAGQAADGAMGLRIS